MGSTLGPNSGPRAGVILTHPNSFPFLSNTTVTRDKFYEIANTDNEDNIDRKDNIDSKANIDSQD
jgi:hypothetical protein